MKFYNNVVSVTQVGKNFVVIDNSNNDLQSALIITLQLINSSTDDIQVSFKRQDVETIEEQVVYKDIVYNSSLTIKSGTTILDHLVVIPPNQQYLVSASSINLVVSCSYGI